MRRVVVLSVGLVPALLLAAPALAAGAGKSGSDSPVGWDVALRGQYTVDGSGTGTYETIIAPEATVDLSGPLGSSTVSAGAELAVDQSGKFTVDDLHLNAEGQGSIDEATSISEALDLDLMQPSLDDTSLPANTAIAPLEFTGTATASATHDFDPLEVTGTLSVQRFMEGETTLDDSSTVDNTSRQYWQANGELRLGYEMTPVMTAFLDGTESYQKFDAADPTLLVPLDGQTTTLRAGLAYNDDGFLSAELSAGPAWHDYTDASLTDRLGWVYDGKVSFTPADALTLSAALDTGIGPSSNTPGDTDVSTTLTGNAAVNVGGGLTLRGSAGWNETTTLGTGDVDNGYSYGAGLDFAPSPGTTWTADYLFTHSFVPPGPATDTQAVTLGLKISG